MKSNNFKTRKMVAVASLAAGMVAGGLSMAFADPIKTMYQMDATLRGCWTPPANTTGSSVTLSFGLNADGSLMGAPQATAINVNGDEQAREAYVEAATKAVESCMPLEFAPDLAQTIAGNVYTIQLSSD